MAKKGTEYRNQQLDVLEYLRTHGSITQMEAYRVFPAPITRLAVAICELRKAGYIIETVDCIGKNCYGTTRYARYELKGRTDEDNNNHNRD